MAPAANHRHRDVSLLPQELQLFARWDSSGEVSWPLDHAAPAINALAANGCVILGLDARTYDEHGGIFEAQQDSDGQVKRDVGAGDSNLASDAAFRRAVLDPSVHVQKEGVPRAENPKRQLVFTG